MSKIGNRNLLLSRWTYGRENARFGSRENSEGPISSPRAEPLSSWSWRQVLRSAETRGYPGFTHHDFRHFFATTCIEAGVDIPTVSRRLGHKDGGALAMRIYGHLRQDHSLAAIQRVIF